MDFVPPDTLLYSITTNNKVLGVESTYLEIHVAKIGLNGPYDK